MATTSASSLVILSSFHPRFRMSVRQPMSFSHSAALARKTRRSATFSQCGGYGGGGAGGGGCGSKKRRGGAQKARCFFPVGKERGSLSERGFPTDLPLPPPGANGPAGRAP